VASTQQPVSGIDLAAINTSLQNTDALAIIQWASQTFGSGLILSSSFGAESALMLHLVTQVVPDIPVVLVDTGYLFPETYRFIDTLSERFKLNLKVYQSPISPARMEATQGRLWEQQTAEALNTYDRIRKVQPMKQALADLNATAWLAGLRGHQTSHRSALRTVEKQNGVYKIHPILGWTTKDIFEYFRKHDLPYHPLYEQGYASIGDWHSTRAITEGMNARDGRFLGLKQECGLHLPASSEEDSSRSASDL
jgi:phosphoadenosine phosphosulfate reductase